MVSSRGLPTFLDFTINSVSMLEVSKEMYMDNNRWKTVCLLEIWGLFDRAVYQMVFVKVIGE